MRLKILSKKFFLFNVIFFAMSLPSDAKCVLETYIIGSKVISPKYCDCDVKEFTPVDDAAIIAFLDDDEIGQIGHSDKSGDFKIKYSYDTYDGPGLLYEDSCGRNPSKLTLVLYLDGFYALKSQFEIKNPVIKEGEQFFEIPPIIFRKISQGEYSSDFPLADAGKNNNGK